MSEKVSSGELEQLQVARVRGLVARDQIEGVDALLGASLLVATERGCMLSPQGFERHEELLREWRAGADLEPLEKAYERFLAVNAKVKETCAAAQAQSGDVEALFVAVDSLEGLLDRVAPALRRAGEFAERFGRYEPRLRSAVESAAAGDARYVTDPAVDNFHSIWFECHEDFLVTLGIDREEEGSY